MNRTTKRIILIALIALGSFFLKSECLFADVNIAVIDSGSKDQYYQSISFTNIPADVDPINHGTNIARIIKEGNPNAKIYVLQVCEKLKNGYTPSHDGILKAIEWCESNDIDIVNLSLVIRYNKKIGEAIKRAHLKKGIIFLAAAGNKKFTSQFAVNSEGHIYLASPNESSMFPEKSKDAIWVGAKDARGTIEDYSIPDADVFSQGEYGSLKGTSFACARISADASKILDQNPNISIEKLKTILRK